MKRTVALITALVIILVSFTACDFEETVSRVGEFSRVIFSDPIEELGAVDVEGDLDKLYSEMITAIEGYELSATFTGVTEDEISDTYLLLYEEHPEYFWITNGYTMDLHTIGDFNAITINIISYTDMEKVPEMRKKLEEESQNILNSFGDLNSDYEKALSVHNLLVDATEYDEEVVERMNNATEVIVEEAHTLYGCIVNKKAVCSGYAAAYQYLLNKLGVECGKVSGTGIETGESHQWNYVVMNGEYYYVDVTWDDPIDENFETYKTFEFFGITTSELLETHTISDKLNVFVPECRGEKYNYYVYNGLYIENYSFKSAEKIISNNLKSKIIEIKFSSKRELERAEKELLTNSRIFEIEGVSQTQIEYTVSNSGKILILSF